MTVVRNACGPVQQDLAADDHVVGHQRQHGRCQQAGAHAVEQPSELERREHAQPSEADRSRACEPVALVELVTDRDDRLEEQWMGAEHGEVRRELRVVCDARALAGVHGLVAVVPDIVEMPEAHEEGDDDDPEQHGRREPACDGVSLDLDRCDRRRDALRRLRHPDRHREGGGGARRDGARDHRRENLGCV